ncbi:uncharacterized protein LOC128883051 isoform X2 [Hylaeus volcanicus]|uniref:uncharacterized protein LOC128883051 isoform X2 n=1 Tax=Hylaeus volcanicus TaxID=313075 RepID=UPI0023B783D2|nr:uncharacterized protein LOC128883051 isoform X2 [Hylaeus volcanicus]
MMEKQSLHFSLVATYDKSKDSNNQHDFGGIPEHLCISNDGKHFFTSSTKFSSYVKAWYQHNTTIVYATSIGPLVGDLQHMTVALHKSILCDETFKKTITYRLATVTITFKVNLWDIHYHENIQTGGIQVNSNPLSCILSEENEGKTNDAISMVEFLQDGETLVCVGCLPFQSIFLFNTSKNHIMAKVPLLTWNPTIKNKLSKSQNPLDSFSVDSTKSQKITMFNFTCLTVDKIPSTLGKNHPSHIGHWVALGDTDSMVALLFFSNSLLVFLKEATTIVYLTQKDVYCHVHLLCSSRLPSFKIVFRPHLVNSSSFPITSTLFNDGWIRHWTREGLGSRVQTVLGENQGSTKAHFIAHGPLTLSHDFSPTDSPIVLLIGSNKNPILSRLDFETDQPTRDATENKEIQSCNVLSTLIGWSTRVINGHRQRKKYLLMEFTSPIVGLATTLDNLNVCILTQEEDLFLIQFQTNDA